MASKAEKRKQPDLADAADTAITAVLPDGTAAAAEGEVDEGRNRSSNSNSPQQKVSLLEGNSIDGPILRGMATVEEIERQNKNSPVTPAQKSTST